MDDDQQFCLRWNNHQSTLISVFDNLLENETLVDCTLAAEGKFLKAHKVVLSACSPYFASLLQEQYDKHPIFILKDVKYQELRAMMDYMYRGEVNISQDQLAALLKAAESLQIKGLSDNRTGAPKHDHHRGLNLPSSMSGGKLSGGYTLEQTKRARVGPSAMDSQDMSGSREGSSSPTRRRRKVRRRSIENAMTEIHDSSNSSQMQSNQSALLQQPANLTGVGAITAAASALTSQIPTSSTGLSTGANAGATGATSGLGSSQQQTTNVTKKTESVKGTSDAMNTENVQTGNIAGIDDQDMEHMKGEKQNHKQKMTATVASAKDTSDLVIEPKSEYDDEGNDEAVEDLTLDEEEMGMDDLDHNAGTSQGGEGSSQGYAPWQQDRSQDELLMTTQDAQQRDPQDVGCENDYGDTIDLPTINAESPDSDTQQGSTEIRDDTLLTTANQNESRIRVRNWLMMADQSILEKSIQDTVGSDNLTNTAITNVTTNNSLLSAASNNSVNSSALISSSTQSTIDPNATKMTRIGSIGRTTIACITPAGVGTQSGTHPLKNGIGVSAAALTAAGVELDPIEDSMTEVIVKIENTGSEEEEEEEQTDDETEENEYNYDLKLSSPISWAYNTVKVENEEFEDIMLTEQDNYAEEEDDLLTTAAATTKQAAETSGVSISGMIEARASRRRTNNTITKTKTKKRLNNQEQQLLQVQRHQQLLEQQRHLQHLQLQPNPQTLQIKLSTIPATITSITPKPINNSSTALKSDANTNTKFTDFQSLLSDDKRYRILIQNQRTRKESLEHSEDMIYNADIEKPWVCRNCNRNYKWKNSLKCHLKNECGQPPRYFCSKLCGYATNVHSNLKRHLNTKCRDRIDEEPKNVNSNSNSSFSLVMQKND